LNEKHKKSKILEEKIFFIHKFMNDDLTEH
jgi:hypothetical protein